MPFWMRCGRNGLLCAFLAAVMVPGQAALAEEAKDAAADADVGPKQPSAEQGENKPSDEADQAALPSTQQGLARVHLRVDGNLAGRVSVLDASGRLVPARATVFFIRDGRLVTTVRSEKTGYFQALGLAPGTYSVVAADGRSATADGRHYVGALSVHVLPYGETLPQERLFLHITLVPEEDLRKLPGEEAGAPTSPGAPRAGVAGGGRRGGLWPLLGLGGLGGLGGLRPATPFTP